MGSALFEMLLPPSLAVSLPAMAWVASASSLTVFLGLILFGIQDQGVGGTEKWDSRSGAVLPVRICVYRLAAVVAASAAKDFGGILHLSI